MRVWPATLVIITSGFMACSPTLHESSGVRLRPDLSVLPRRGAVAIGLGGRNNNLVQATSTPERDLDHLERDCFAERDKMKTAQAKALDRASTAKTTAGLVTGLVTTLFGAGTGVLAGACKSPTCAEVGGTVTAVAAAAGGLWVALNTAGSEELKNANRKIDDIDTYISEANLDCAPDAGVTRPCANAIDHLVELCPPQDARAASPAMPTAAPMPGDTPAAPTPSSAPPKP